MHQRRIRITHDMRDPAHQRALEQIVGVPEGTYADWRDRELRKNHARRTRLLDRDPDWDDLHEPTKPCTRGRPDRMPQSRCSANTTSPAAGTDRERPTPGWADERDPSELPVAEEAARRTSPCSE